MDHLSPTFRNGQRVKSVGLVGNYDGPEGRVSRMVKGGVKVRWDSGVVEVVHPDGLRLIEPGTTR